MQDLQANSFDIDPVHEKLNPFDIDIILAVYRDKYRYGNERHPNDTFLRVADGIYANDKEPYHYEDGYRAMASGLLMPGGRIIAGAGTEKLVTLMNCFVNEKVDDSMQGILHALENVGLTLQQGGGIGTDFSTIRPKGALLRRTGEGSEASGPLPFMTTWDSLSKTIKSAGARRGAMMGTLHCTHPDLIDFVKAKQTQGVLTQFNVSILVTDAFLKAVENDDLWDLYFPVPPVGREDGTGWQFVDIKGVTQHIYSTHRARELWDLIMRSTYEYSEPGVIFIDRINQLNPLNYCELISCTNPCGEQPLPPHGACNLGNVNLARMVRHPFTERANFDYNLLNRVVRTLTRFLDNALDVTNYPLPEQAEQQRLKRRIGIGISGLADALAMLGVRYGSSGSVVHTQKIQEVIANQAYLTSAHLAAERGVFPLYVEAKHLDQPFIRKLSPGVRTAIRQHGLRNGVLLDIAPTGTTSLFYGNISSGLEPVFAHESDRKVFDPKDDWVEYKNVPGYSFRVYKHIHGNCEVDELPEHMVTAADLSVDDHLRIQAACQEWVDASITKTINLSSGISLEDFKNVYRAAYDLGCKGCTTYRPSDVRGHVMKASKPKGKTDTKDHEGNPTLLAEPLPDNYEELCIKADKIDTSLKVSRGHKISDLAVGQTTLKVEAKERPRQLWGCTYKVKWPSMSSALYITINHREDGEPHEMFLQSKDVRYQEWMTALTLMITSVMRRGGDVAFLADELIDVKSAHDTAYLEGKFYGSLISYIGTIVKDHFENIGVINPPVAQPVKEAPNGQVEPVRGEICPECGNPTLVREEGCQKCKSCTYTKC